MLLHNPGLITGQVIAIDGKTIRGAKSHGKKSAIHMVSAWACENNLVLGQIKVDEKSNEITAIPKLLEILAIEDSIITIDAMGCQKNIAETIIENDANYILAVKENQATLLESIQDEFLFSKQITKDVSVDADHGRIETRTCSVITDFQHVVKDGDWRNLNAVVKIESKRTFKNSDKPTKKQRKLTSVFNGNGPKFSRLTPLHMKCPYSVHKFRIRNMGFRYYS